MTECITATPFEPNMTSFYVFMTVFTAIWIFGIWKLWPFIMDAARHGR